MTALFPADRLGEVARIKRFLELVEGDPDFRLSAREAPAERQTLLAQAGMDLPASDLLSFWNLVDVADLAPSGLAEVSAEIALEPLGSLWGDWVAAEMRVFKEALQEWPPAGPAHLAAWHRRKTNRARSEALSGTHPTLLSLFGFELSKGCSVQCPFCGLDAPMLQGHFPYAAGNRRFWRELLGVARDLFGTATRSASLYHATEPADNPDYFRFLEDFHEIVGILPQTTTARPLQDPGWTRQLPRLSGASTWPHDRFSVLSLPLLRRIHRAFTPDELLHVDLVLMNRGALGSKAPAGRALGPARAQTHGASRARAESASAACTDDVLTPYPPSGTIDCTCGWVVNLVDRNIRLVSPCRASEEHPLGSIVHAQGTFGDAASFREFLEGSMASAMRQHLDKYERLAFREDLTVESLPDGFALRSPYRRHVVRGHPQLPLLARLIGEGRHAPADLTTCLVEEGMPVLEAVAWPDRLFQAGQLAQS
ncbi:MAG: radical SAM family RiPP maturation amino acid epimerase [Gemmatimonadetes bacterium]|nr:radical SAM family RiPP maturation amino acid epimerase [Gemmatimonadota bacterium]